MVFNPQPKPQRLKDEKYLEYIRSLPCVNPLHNCRAEPHHESGLSNDPGWNVKCSDHLTIPLCRECHTNRDGFGFKTFWAGINLDPAQVVIKLLSDYVKEHIIKKPIR